MTNVVAEAGGGIRSILDAVAAFLGLVEDDLERRLEAGETLAEITEAQGLSIDDLKATITGAYQADLAQRVAAGELSQEEADEKLAELSANSRTS